jgi:Coenzyme PQQ synthesis protein D (PqqD)
MSAEKRFRVSGPRVMHETIDGEVILIALDTGTYYSLREAGADVWAGIEQGAAEGEILEALSRRYDASAEEMRPAVRSLLEQLQAEGLVDEAEGGPGGRVELPEAGNGRRPFSAPTLEKHTDMQDLILLDPVHEVDATGWPHAAPDAS